MIIVYSQPSCLWCNKAKELLDSKSAQYTEITVGEDISKEEFMDKFPGIRSLPLITHRNRYPPTEHIVGGYQELYDSFK